MFLPMLSFIFFLKLLIHGVLFNVRSFRIFLYDYPKNNGFSDTDEIFSEMKLKLLDKLLLVCIMLLRNESFLETQERSLQRPLKYLYLELTLLFTCFLFGFFLYS
jgi:hypothetical protein